MSTDGDVVREAHQDAKDVLATCLPGYGVKLFDADERFDAALARLEARCERLELIRERRIEADLAFRKTAYAHIERLEGALREIAEDIETEPYRNAIAIARRALNEDNND